MSSDLIYQSSVRNFIERFCQIQKYDIHINTFIDTICDIIQKDEKRSYLLLVTAALDLLVHKILKFVGLEEREYK